MVSSSHWLRPRFQFHQLISCLQVRLKISDFPQLPSRRRGRTQPLKLIDIYDLRRICVVSKESESSDCQGHHLLHWDIYKHILVYTGFGVLLSEQRGKTTSATGLLLMSLQVIDFFVFATIFPTNLGCLDLHVVV